MTKILVTGANGLLGSSLVPHLRQCGYELFCHGRSGDAEVRADLTDSGQVFSALNKVAPEIIVHLAALTNVDACERNPQAAYLANVRCLENIARWMEMDGNGCHLVQISTDQVYDGLGPHVEADITLTNYYGFSKYAGELVATAVSGTVLRTNFFGVSRSLTRTSLSDWLVKSLSKGEPITVFDDVFFSPLSLQSLVQLISLVILKRPSGVYNLGSRAGMSKADFAFALADTLNLSVQTMRRGSSDHAGLGAYRPKDMRMDSGRFEGALGIVLPSLAEEIQTMKGIYANET